MGCKIKLLGIVTLYYPDAAKTIRNINTYIQDIDTLLIFDNTPLEAKVRAEFAQVLQLHDNIVWHGTGENHYIAKAVNYGWRLMKEKGYEAMLIMDQDSHWTDFHCFAKDALALIESDTSVGAVFPFVPSVETQKPEAECVMRRFFINSGTILPMRSLDSIGGADERFYLDALDNDLSVRIQKAGLKLYCLTKHILIHELGKPRKVCYLPFGTNDYSSRRIYSITKCHILFLRKHAAWLTWSERWKEIKETLIVKPITILLIEKEKKSRIRAFIKGVIQGLKG